MQYPSSKGSLGLDPEAGAPHPEAGPSCPEAGPSPLTPEAVSSLTPGPIPGERSALSGVESTACVARCVLAAVDLRA